MDKNIYNLMELNNCKLSYKVSQFNGAQLINSWVAEQTFIEDDNVTLIADGKVWQISSRVEALKEGVADLFVGFRLTQDNFKQCNTSICLEFDNWSKDNYVILPAAVYNGNRFEARNLPYPPQLSDANECGVNMPTIITDVPRLNINSGISKIHQLAGDMATPAVGFCNEEKGSGFWLLTEQDTILGDSGIELEENEDRSKASITISAPGVRQDYRYAICDTKYPSKDKGADFNQGDSVELHVRLHFFKCNGIQELFNYFVNIRKALTGEVNLHHEIPFYSAWNIQHNKYNTQNWEDTRGYYSVGMRDNIHQDWQIGWVGGLMVTYPMLFEGSPLSKERVLKNYDFVFSGGQDKSGFFHGCGHQGKWYGDFFRDLNVKWHLVRKSADVLYFMVKQFMLMGKQGISSCIKSEWVKGVKKCADAFVTIWNKYGQFGQFVDTETGDIIIGGSACAGIAPAGLALAWEYFGTDEYIQVAKQSAQYFYDNFVKKGFTTGGPGEICQCPDSESAFALLESYIVLYEVTQQSIWLDMAKDIGNQCISWCVSYDFKFPAQSTFGRLNMHTAGSVYANVQNKHSAPAICTLSGDSLFKLFRATGDLKYLEVIQEIAHNLPQYLSREDRPIRASNGQYMPAGWMNERVEMCDWLEPIGEIFYGSCWCEVSNMVTWVEIPGLYVQPDTGFICTIDHVNAEVIEKTVDGSVVVKITNPTKFEACVRVMVENSTRMGKVMGQNALWGCQMIRLAAGETKLKEFKESTSN